MTGNVADAHTSPIAAVIYRAEDDVDTLLAEFAFARLRAGDRLGGIVQRNIKDASGRKLDMQLVDLMTGHTIGISQPLGSGAGSCKLDPTGLADSSQAVQRAIASGANLVVINKFSKQEASGRGLRNEFADVIVAGLPLLTAVPEKCADAWREFTGDQAAALPCGHDAVEAWWREIIAQTRPASLCPPFDRSSAPTEDRDWLWATIC
jgi:nucleoside-triphosphatase THEP1